MRSLTKHEAKQCSGGILSVILGIGGTLAGASEGYNATINAYQGGALDFIKTAAAVPFNVTTEAVKGGFGGLILGLVCDAFLYGTPFAEPTGYTISYHYQY